MLCVCSAVQLTVISKCGGAASCAAITEIRRLLLKPPAGLAGFELGHQTNRFTRMNQTYVVRPRMSRFSVFGNLTAKVGVVNLAPPVGLLNLVMTDAKTGNSWIVHVHHSHEINANFRSAKEN